MQFQCIITQTIPGPAFPPKMYVYNGGQKNCLAVKISTARCFFSPAWIFCSAWIHLNLDSGQNNPKLVLCQTHCQCWARAGCPMLRLSPCLFLYPSWKLGVDFITRWNLAHWSVSKKSKTLRNSQSNGKHNACKYLFTGVNMSCLLKVCCWLPEQQRND